MSDVPKDSTPPSDGPGAEAFPDRPSPAGVRSIQGLSAPPSDTEAVRQLAPDERFSPPDPLGPSESNDLELATQRAEAAKATRYHNDGDRSRLAEYQRLRSEIGEELAVQNITGGVQADAFSRAGTNFPNYDVLAPAEVSSVKVYSLDEGKPRFDRYHADFSELVNPDSNGNRTAAERLMEIRAEHPEMWQQLSPHLPDGVRAAETAGGMQAALAEKASLRIPADQADEVRADLRKDMRVYPKRYGLDPNAEPHDRALQIERTVQTRVLSIDDRFTTAHYQAKAADRVGLRDLAMERRLPGGREK